MASNPQIRIAATEKELSDLSIYAIQNATTSAEILGWLLSAFLVDDSIVQRQFEFQLQHHGPDAEEAPEGAS